MRLLHFSLFFTFITGSHTSDPSHVPDSYSDLVSTSRDSSDGVTRLPGIPGFETASVRQGGGRSGSGDNTSLRVVPQDGTHNGQEKAGSATSDLAYTTAPSLTHSTRSFTEKQPDTRVITGQTQWAGLSVSELQTSEASVSTAVQVSSRMSTDVHAEDKDTPSNLKVSHSDDITVMTSGPASATTSGNGATVPGLEESESLAVRHIMTTSSSADEGTDTAHGSRQTFRTSHFYTNPDLSVSDNTDDSVTDLHSVTYISDITARSLGYTGTPEITVSDPKHSSSVTQDDTAVPSFSGTTTHRKGAESYSHSPPYTRSLKADSPSPPSASPAIRNEFATDTEHATDWHTSHTVTSPSRDVSSYPPSTLGPTNSHTLHTHFSDLAMTPVGPSTVPYDSTDTRGHTKTETRTQSDTEITHTVTVTTDLNNLSDAAARRPTPVTQHASHTSGDDHAALTTHLSRLTSLSTRTHTLGTVTTGAPPTSIRTSLTSHLMMTAGWVETRTPNRLTTSRPTLSIRRPPHPTTQQVYTHTRPGTHTHSTPQTLSHRTITIKTTEDWSHRGRVFITEEQPAAISVDSFPVLLQVILEKDVSLNPGLEEMEPFLQKVGGYQSQRVTWRSGPVLQSVLNFRTVEAVSWLGRAESLLQEAGLRPLPAQGVFVSGVRVKNITVGGLHSDACSWLFSCPSDFYCVLSERNITCRSVCHSAYCRNHGICVHRPGHQPLCQCPVGEDFWFMGRRCDLLMTQLRLAGVCFGVLATVAVLMGLLAYVSVQHYKKTLFQAKVEQTQSSYRRFNHFDELSARFWRRSWPGSEDSLDNVAFSRSDELLHMRAMDHACCYHDDTLSIASTYPESVAHLNTVYPHSCQYHWDMSMCSVADGIVDSGKASDLSVCSWPIEPIQWTPFPLLQQLGNTRAMKASRPHSYCEGMELVGLEKSRTA